jgi:uncharacterized membrane protein
MLPPNENPATDSDGFCHAHCNRDSIDPGGDYSGGENSDSTPTRTSNRDSSGDNPYFNNGCCDRHSPSGAISYPSPAYVYEKTVTLYSPVMLVTIYWLHMLATVAWIGGQTTLAVLVLPAARKTISGASRYPEFIGQLSRRLQLTGWLSLVVLTATGLFQMSSNSSYQGFLAITNPWATAILLKHLVIGVLVLSSAYLTWGLTPTLERMILLRAHGKGSPVALGALQRREERLIQINLAISVIVLLLTAWARSSSGQ